MHPNSNLTSINSTIEIIIYDFNVFSFVEFFGKNS